MIRLVIAFLTAAAACMLVAGALTSAQSTSTSTPDAYVTQITSSNRLSATTQVGSFASDMSANGRFVVVESNGDIATQKVPSKKPDGTPNLNPRNNEDGNREIFL